MLVENLIITGLKRQRHTREEICWFEVILRLLKCLPNKPFFVVRCVCSVMHMSCSQGQDDVQSPGLFSREKVCKWVRRILHVAPSACQNLSLIVRGHCLHKAKDVSKDLFNSCVWEKYRKRPACSWNYTDVSHVTTFTSPGHEYSVKGVHCKTLENLRI